MMPTSPGVSFSGRLLPVVSYGHRALADQSSRIRNSIISTGNTFQMMCNPITCSNNAYQSDTHAIGLPVASHEVEPSYLVNPLVSRELSSMPQVADNRWFKLNRLQLDPTKIFNACKFGLAGAIAVYALVGVLAPVVSIPFMAAVGLVGATFICCVVIKFHSEKISEGITLGVIAYMQGGSVLTHIVGCTLIAGSVAAGNDANMSDATTAACIGSVAGLLGWASGNTSAAGASSSTVGFAFARLSDPLQPQLEPVKWATGIGAMIGGWLLRTPAGSDEVGSNAVLAARVGNQMGIVYSCLANPTFPNLATATTVTFAPLITDMLLEYTPWLNRIPIHENMQLTLISLGLYYCGLGSPYSAFICSGATALYTAADKKTGGMLTTKVRYLAHDGLNDISFSVVNGLKNTSHFVGNRLKGVSNLVVNSINSANFSSLLTGCANSTTHAFLSLSRVAAGRVSCSR
ncbi:hypothetical protein SK355_05675 [Candidatus Fukatsuia symbiotica]|nr:hypothetical protein [Candidatus Fukatsuia symbiotica]MEA9444776.1 hypothetical protein [Candidatus Fukatsuia symbiotica]